MFLISSNSLFFTRRKVVDIAIDEPWKHSPKLGSVYQVFWIKFLFWCFSIGFESHDVELTSGFCKEFHVVGNRSEVRKFVTSFLASIWSESNNLYRKHTHHLGCFDSCNFAIKTCSSDRAFVRDIDTIRPRKRISNLARIRWITDITRTSCTMSSSCTYWSTTTTIVIITWRIV